MNILMIEDNAVEALSLMNTLNNIMEEPLDLVHEETLAEGLAHLDDPNKVIDLVFLDVNLPDVKDWRSVRDKISPYTAKTPFIVVSGDDNGKAEKKLLREGAEDYIVKGSERRKAERLKDAVDHALARHKAVEELADKVEEKKEVVHWLTGGYTLKPGTLEKPDE